jgi:ABC-type Na+ efflux pump permease subunit
MKTLSIAVKDLQILFKDRGTLFQLFVLPLLFIMVFSGALGALAGGDEAEAALPSLAVVDLDGGEAAQTLLSKLVEDGSLAVQSTSQAEAQTQLEDNQVIGMLVIPTGFSSGVESGTPVKLVFTTGTQADMQTAEAARLLLESIAADMTGQIIASPAADG